MPEHRTRLVPELLYYIQMRGIVFVVRNTRFASRSVATPDPKSVRVQREYNFREL
jgi:hypothetical protein